MRRPTRADCLLMLIMLLACVPALLPTALSLLRAVASPGAWSDIPSGPARWVLIARAGWVAALIACLATLAGWPLAQLLRRCGGRLAAILLAPVWMPAWLTYAGLNLARAPDTWIGGLVLDAALPDHRWAIVLLGRVVAIASLVLWTAPIAALVIAAFADPDADAAEELLHTEHVSFLRRTGIRFRLRRASLSASLGAVFLLTFGSSVPLHLAQIETDAIVLWRAIAERTPDRWAGVWLAAWPQLIIAALGSAWFVRRAAARPRPGESVAGGGRIVLSRWTRAIAVIVWIVAALLPTALMLWSLDAWASIPRWFALNADALGSSAQIAGVAGLLTGTAAVLIAAGHASERAVTRAVSLTVAGACVFSALVPGVLIGAAIAGMRLDDGVAAMLAAMARTLFIAGIAGVVAGGVEPPDVRAMRSMDARGDARGWVRVHGLRASRLCAGVWIASFLIGLHEIEAATLVRPPGTGNLPQQMLSDLHYARLEQLSAGGVVIGLLGITLGAVASGVLSLRVRQLDRLRAVPPQI
ncbi:MAG: hypothetical protein AAGA55_05675 [Planctomycetota bacterium]